MKSIVSLDKVSKVYEIGDASIKALDEINLNICSGNFLSIMGPSGSGKTTLLDVLSTLLRPSSGEVFIEGVSTTKMSNLELSSFRGKKIGFIFQTFNLLPKTTALDNVMVPLWINGVPRQKREKIARDLLEEVGLGNRLHNKSNELSGGQKQRVAIARALAMDPAIIVADEPTGNLDTASGEAVIEIIKGLHEEKKKTVVLVTHDQHIGKMAHDIVYIRDGKITSDSKKVCPML